MFRDLKITLSEVFGGGNKLDPNEEVTIEVLFGLLGYLSKIDSIVTSHEADFINEQMDELHLPTRGRQLAMEALEKGRKRQMSISDELARFTAIHPAGSLEVAKLYDTLIRLAASDERIRPREREFLEEVTVCLGYDIGVLDTRLRGIAQPKA